MELKWKHQVPTICWCICYFMKPCCIWISQTRLNILLLRSSVKDIGTSLSLHCWFLWAVLVNTKNWDTTTATPLEQKQLSWFCPWFWTNHGTKGYNELYKESPFCFPQEPSSYLERELRMLNFCWRDGYVGPGCFLANGLLSTETQ